MKLSRRIRFCSFLLILALSACQTPSTTPTQTTTVDETDLPAAATPATSPTPEPLQSLTVCTAAIPDNLFLYSGQNSAARSAILAMIQDELFFEGGGILSEIPAEGNDGLSLQPVNVEVGQTVVDAYGELVVLRTGVAVRPSGCRDSSCVLTWDGESALLMDQLVLNFHLTDGLTWSDGVPVTAGDSVFSYQVARLPDAPGLQWAEMRTASYTAVDEKTVTWIGKPGFTTSEPGKFFWTPLPSHAADGASDWSTITGLSQFTTLPLSYGPFAITSRSEDAVVLTRNPYYYRLDEGLPVLDEITVQTIEKDAATAVASLANGACDVLDSSFGLEDDLETVAALQADSAYDVLVTSTGSWEQLVFGIKPASYDEYFNPLYGDRPDYFGDVRTRQAIALCLDREALLNTGLAAITSLMPGFVSEAESQLLEGTGFVYDPQSGLALLESAGWRDHDLNPATPLQAWEVAGVPAGTSFSVTLLTGTSALQQSMAGTIQDSLGQCGINVAVTALPAEQLYAPGPDGLVFGRQFDLTLIAWQAMPDLDCGYYQSRQIPSDDNQWIGTNIAGLADEAYDQACSTAALALPAERDGSLHHAEEVFVDTTVAIPLFSLSHVMVTSSAGCNGKSISTEDEFFAFLEYYEISGNCP
jgi:peptide/nickel transport system substrate-binding protein